MSRWAQGEAEIEAMLARGELQALSGAAADGHRFLAKAELTLRSVTAVAAEDPDSSFVLAYDAARQALSALLAQQGLRATTKGGHHAVEKAARAQFGQGFRPFGTLWRRRNELEYPERPGDSADWHEADEAIAAARQILAAVTELMDHVGFFSTR